MRGETSGAVAKSKKMPFADVGSDCGDRSPTGVDLQPLSPSALFPTNALSTAHVHNKGRAVMPRRPLEPRAQSIAIVTWLWHYPGMARLNFLSQLFRSVN